MPLHMSREFTNRLRNSNFINLLTIKQPQHRLEGHQTGLSDVTTVVRSVIFDETVRMRHSIVRTIRMNNPQLQVHAERLLMKVEKLECT